jgi:hypothetical protein
MLLAYQLAVKKRIKKKNPFWQEKNKILEGGLLRFFFYFYHKIYFLTPEGYSFTRVQMLHF